MRAMLVINPRATTTSSRVIDVIVRALSSEWELDVTMTTHRGHAHSLGEFAAAHEIPVVITLGGDGVVNELVNGLLHEGPCSTIVAPLPGGSGNVFARALGLPLDPVEATGLLLEAIRDEKYRRISLGHVAATRLDGSAFTRYFLANAGLGFDAKIISAMEADRAKGHVASPGRYLLTTIRQYLRSGKHEPFQLIRPGLPPVDHVYAALIQNSAPWTFFGSWALDPNPSASFDTGLNAFIVRKLDPISTARAARRIIMRSRKIATAGAYLTWHDQRAFTARPEKSGSSAPGISLQLDGEGLGEITEASFTNVPRALITIQTQD